MNYEQLYGNTLSTIDTPSAVVRDIMALTIPDVDAILQNCEFHSADEIRDAYAKAWFAVATDRWLNSRRTQEDMPTAKLLLTRAKKICTTPNMVRAFEANAESLWLRVYEKKALTTRRNEAFSGEINTEVYLAAKKRLASIYGFSETDLEYLRYFVCQARTDGFDTALNRSLYLYSTEKMTGKTTVAKIIAGILNGYTTWHECQSGVFMSDIPTELQFERFARPKGSRFACVVMDEAFAGKSTSKYYGKFKTAITSGTCAVEIKNGGKFDIPCYRNYVFTSNNDVASVVADESERRMFVIQMRKPEQLPYEELFDIWRDFIVNAPSENNIATWYRNTMQAIVGEVGIQKTDIISALLSTEFNAAISQHTNEVEQRINTAMAQGKQVSRADKYQVAYPRFFLNFINLSFDVRKSPNIVKEAVIEAFGQPKVSGTRKYYNVADLKATLDNIIDTQDESQLELELPY